MSERAVHKKLNPHLLINDCIFLTNKARTAQLRQRVIPVPDSLNIFTMELKATLFEQRSNILQHHPESVQR